MDETFSKAVGALQEFFAKVDPSDFYDDEHKSRVIEGCEMLLSRVVKVSEAETAVSVLNYPPETSYWYSEFVSAMTAPKKPAVEEDRVTTADDIRNSILEYFMITAKDSDNFLVIRK